MKKWGVGLAFLLATTSAMAKDIQLLNISYDPTRELYEQYSKAFGAYWKQQTGDNVVTRQSHGGSDKQAASVVNGIGAGAVILALAYGADAIAERGRTDKEWVERLPDNSTPYTSTTVFLVRKDNPEQIHDQNDLIKPGALVITPNPKSSGGAHWNCLAAWGYALRHNNDDQVRAQDSVRTLYKNIEVLDSGARGSINTFVERGISDVLITWGSEALLAANKPGKDKFEIVTPGESILVEPTVSVVDKVVEKKDTREVMEAYLKYLYSLEGRETAAKNYYHLCGAEVAKKHENAFLKLKLLIIGKEFGGRTKTQKEHSASGGMFDQVSKR